MRYFLEMINYHFVNVLCGVEGWARPRPMTKYEQELYDEHCPALIAEEDLANAKHDSEYWSESYPKDKAHMMLGKIASEVLL